MPTSDFVIEGKPIQIQLAFKATNVLIQSYYEDGFWINNRIKYDTYGGDREHHYNHIKYFVTDAAKKGDKESNGLYWNGITVGKIFALIDRYTNTQQHVRDGKFFAYLNVSNMGSSHAFIRAETDEKDNLTMSIDFDLVINRDDTDYSSKVVDTFPSKTPPETVANTMLDKFKANQANAHDPEKMVEYLAKYFGFNFK